MERQSLYFKLQRYLLHVHSNHSMGDTFLPHASKMSTSLHVRIHQPQFLTKGVHSTFSKTPLPVNFGTEYHMYFPML